MNSPFYKLTLFLVLLTGIGQASAGPAIEWMRKMSDAMRNLSYQGNFVYLSENQLESMSIYHVKNDSGERERLLSLNGEAREVIRDNKNLVCIWPSSKVIVVDNARQNTFSPLYIPGDVARLEKYYEMNVVGEDRIANYDAVVVHIAPRDQYRYGLKLWINAENGLLLKSNLINERNEVVEQVMFTNIELISDSEQLQSFAVPDIDDNFTMVRYLNDEAGENMQADMNWQVSDLPDGFRKESTLYRRVGETSRNVQQIVYTDGLASLSVFIEKQTPETIQGETSMGAINGYIYLVNNYSVTAIGEVPLVTVKQVAESVSFNQP